MKQYNIYAGLGGNFGGAYYQYTTLANSLKEAQHEAWEAAYNQFNLMEGCHNFYNEENFIKEYCLNNNRNRDELKNVDLAIIEELYSDELDKWLCFDAILTEEDNIDKDNLILGYIVEDDSSNQTGSK